jgi:hypothetical protein
LAVVVIWQLVGETATISSAFANVFAMCGHKILFIRLNNSFCLRSYS